MVIDVGLRFSHRQHLLTFTGLQVIRRADSYIRMVWIESANGMQTDLLRDESFNSITGLNGSGKSNILDAICFVLGITNMSTVRAQNLQVCRSFDSRIGLTVVRI